MGKQLSVFTHVIHSKDDFSHKLTSSKFTHTCIKREKLCAFFASSIILSISSYWSKACFSSPIMVYPQHMLIVL